MQYMLLIHSDDSGFFAMKPAEQQQAMGAYMAFTEALRKAGALVGSNRLMPSSDATIVRAANGKSQVLNGPFTDTKDAIVIAYEANYGLRWIFTDGRSLPANDPQPFWYGYSVGRWDGDELIVETIGLRDDGWLDVNGTPFGNTTRVTEKFRRVNYGRLEIDVTVEDPKFYTKPFTTRVNWRLYPEGELIEFICNENEQSSQHLVVPK